MNEHRRNTLIVGGTWIAITVAIIGLIGFSIGTALIEGTVEVLVIVPVGVFAWILITWPVSMYFSQTSNASGNVVHP